MYLYWEWEAKVACLFVSISFSLILSHLAGWRAWVLNMDACFCVTQEVVSDKCAYLIWNYIRLLQSIFSVFFQIPVVNKDWNNMSKAVKRVRYQKFALPYARVLMVICQLPDQMYLLLERLQIWKWKVVIFMIVSLSIHLSLFLYIVCLFISMKKTFCLFVCLYIHCISSCSHCIL